MRVCVTVFSYFLGCGVRFLVGSLSQLLLLDEDVPQVFIHLKRKRERERERETGRQTEIKVKFQTNTLNGSSVLERGETRKHGNKSLHTSKKDFSAPLLPIS